VKADGFSVSKLRNSGAILVRRTNMHEFNYRTFAVNFSSMCFNGRRDGED